MFKKSSFCFGGLGCVEVQTPEFKKASACALGACAEASVGSEKVLVRHSGNPDVVLSFTPDEWRAFIAGVKAGEFDLPK